MGWLSMQRAHTRDDGSITARTVIASSCVANRTYYAAVQHHDDGVAGDIYAIICLVRWTPRASDGFLFSYKDMDETVGPCEAECPERILRLLTPRTYEHAIEWRRRCWDNLRLRARPITDGLRIKLPAPMTFTDGYVGDEFIIRKRGASISLTPVDGHGYHRISNFRSHAWTAVAKTTVHRTSFQTTPAG